MAVDKIYNKTSKPAEEAMALPLDIMIIIFLKLQIRALFHCKSVCKLWRNTINSCYFADLHRTRSHRESKLLLICHPSIKKPSSNTFEFYAINPQFSSNTFTLTQLPITEFTRIHRVRNLSHGLILVKGDGPNYILYNPIRGEKLVLPPTTIINKEEVDANTGVFGLGFDDSSKQYKLVCITEVLSCDGSINQAIEIHTLGSNKWRRLTSTPPCSIFVLGILPTSAYGDVHWMTRTNGNDRKIVSFIFTKEEFKFSPLPDAITSLPDARDSFSLFNWRGELAILETSSRKTLRDTTIWVLRDYENAKWERMYALDLPPFPPRCKVATWADDFVFNISSIPWLVNGEMIDDRTHKLLHWDAKKGDIAVTINTALSGFLRRRGRCYEILETDTDNLDSLTSYADSVPDGSTPNHAQPS